MRPVPRRSLPAAVLWLIPTMLLPALVSRPAAAQTQRPAGPPWTEVCAPLDDGGFKLIFSSDQCAADFDRAFAQLSAAAMHQWMVDHQSCFHEWAHFSWLAFSRNDPKMATLAWSHQLYMANQRLGEDVDELLQRGTTGTISADAAAYTNKFLDQVELNTTYKAQMDEAYSAVTPICLYHLSPECVGAMNQVLDWMYPRSYQLDGQPPEYMTYSMLPFYREMFADTQTQVYASRLAQTLVAKISAGAAVVPAETLYTLGMQAFNGDEERFWKFMIVYATRGAAWATGYQMAHADNKPLFAAMMVISAAMGYLDITYAQQGYAWSYLPNTASTCYQPKPYHFWMAAGYAYLLREQNYTPTASRLVGRLLGALYELGSTTEGHDPDQVFFVPPFDPAVNRTRRELAHHFLGTELGVAAAQPADPDFDAALAEFMDHSTPLPALSDDELRKELQDRLTKWQLWTKLTGYYINAL